MIIHRYIFKEITTVFISILLVLTLTLLSQQFVRYLSYVALGKVPANAVLSLVGFEIPYLFVFLLPLTIYLSLFWVYSRLKADHEMTILEMSGFGIKQFLSFTLVIATIIATTVFVLMNWVNPWIADKRQLMMNDDDSTTRLIQTLIPGRFHISSDEKRVIYVETLSRDRTLVGNVFMAEMKNADSLPIQWNIMVAKDGKQAASSSNNGNYFILHDGYRYEGIPGQNNYKIIKFYRYAIQVPENNIRLTHSNRETLDINQLLQHHNNVKYNAELQWRFAMPILTIILSMIALPLSYIAPRQSRYKRLLPAILLFIIYVNLLMLSKRWIEDGFLPTILGLWWVHGTFFIIALYLIRFNYYRRN